MKANLGQHMPASIYDIYEALSLMAIAKYSCVHDWEYDRERFEYFCTLAYAIRSDLALLMEKMTDKNIRIFNVMAPIGGPMHIRSGASCHIRPFTCTTFECMHDCWIGYINLWNDQCGVDNFKLILEHDDEI